MNYNTTTFAPVICPSWHRLALIFLLISTSGCTTFRPDRWYLHNSAHKDLADQAKSNWTPVQDNLWQSMLKNQKLTADAEIQTQRLLQQSVVKSHHLQLINMTWSEMKEKISEYEDLLTKEKENLEKDKQSALEESTEIGKEIKKLMEKNQDRQKAVDEAKANVETWQKELDLFEKATHDFLLQQANESEPDGKPIDTQNFLKELQTQANAIAGNKDLKKVITQKGIIDRPPGVTLEILNLGADLAKAQLDRAKMIERRLQEENNLIDARQKEIEANLTWIKSSIAGLDDPLLKNKLGTSVFASIQKSLNNQTAPDTDTDTDTEGFITALQRYVLADDLYTINDHIYEITKEALKHYYEIENSAISSKEREALIQRGLETLAVYHNGGITQEEINTIIQAAQAVALAVISAGVI